MFKFFILLKKATMQYIAIAMETTNDPPFLLSSTFAAYEATKIWLLVIPVCRQANLFVVIYNGYGVMNYS